VPKQGPPQLTSGAEHIHPRKHPKVTGKDFLLLEATCVGGYESEVMPGRLRAIYYQY